MDELKSKLLKFMDEYARELAEAKREGKYKRPLGDFVRQDIAGCLRGKVDPDLYKVKGSVGGGLWTDVPWIAVFDKRITESAQKGVYIVYLLNKDTKTLYLTLNQGATEASKEKTDSKKGDKAAFTGIASSNSRKAIERLLSNANSIRETLGNRYKLSYEGLITGSKSYDAGCVFYIEYTMDSLPEDEQLYSDLQLFLDIYNDYYEKIFSKNADEVEKTSGTKETGKDEANMGLTVKETIQSIKKYIDSKGFTYENGLLENLYLSLKSKPFVILAGTSGTGKTKLVKLFADAIGAESLIVSVRPDWSDSSDLFGHTDLNGNFIDGPVCKAFEAAFTSPKKPVLLCLDEMNLSRVEYYLSDFLSIIETRERKEGCVITNPIAQYKGGIPDNLYLIGTVNMDETTFPFSKKVLDRANTIEFNYVDLLPQAGHITEECSAMDLPNSFLHTDYLILNDCMDDEEFVRKVCTELQSLNHILVKANAHVGFRVRDEIVFYMLNNKNSGELLSYEQAMDNEILQKILPRIQGSSAAIKTLLIELYQFCMGNDSGIDSETGNAGEDMKSKASSARYPLSAQKLGYMMTRYEDDGFTSYWL